MTENGNTHTYTIPYVLNFFSRKYYFQPSRLEKKISKENKYTHLCTLYQLYLYDATNFSVRHASYNLFARRANLYDIHFRCSWPLLCLITTSASIKIKGLIKNSMCRSCEKEIYYTIAILIYFSVELPIIVYKNYNFSCIFATNLLQNKEIFHSSWRTFQEF